MSSDTYLQSYLRLVDREFIKSHFESNMAQTNDELRRLIEKRGRLKSNLTRFKIFYDAHGQSTDSLQEWLNRTVLFIEVLQERIKTTVSHWLPPISLPSFSGVSGSSFAIALNRWLIAMTLSLTSRSFTTSYSLWRMRYLES